MHVDILHIVATLVLFRGQAHQAILVEEDSHRVYHCRYQHIDSEIVFMLLPQRGLLNVLLDHVGVVVRFGSWYFGLQIVKHCSFFGFSVRFTVSLRRLLILFNTELLLHSCCLLFKCLINSFLELFDSFDDKNTAALATSLRFHYIKTWAILCRLFRCHEALSHFILTFPHFFGVVFLQLVQVSWIEPRVWKKVVLRSEFFSEFSQMNAKRILSRNVIHSQKVIDSLVWQKV